MGLKVFLYSVFAIAVTFSSCLAEFVVGPEPTTHKGAVDFCAGKNLRLADITSENRPFAAAQLKKKPVWIGSWNSDFYNGANIYLFGEHVGFEEGSKMMFPLCNPPNLLKAGHPENAVAGPRASRKSRASANHRRHDSSSSEFHHRRPNFVYEYVYLTQTVSNVYVSSVTTTSVTETVTIAVFTATVQAFSVTPVS